MVKLKDKEIQDAIELETGTSDLPLPGDAHSKFRFEIEENIEDLMQKMSNPTKHHSPQERHIDAKTGEVSFTGGEYETQWLFHKTAEAFRECDGDYRLEDPHFYCEARVWEKEGGLKIETAWGGYVYDIRQNEDAKGCSVEFSGPVNALLRQNLLPEMTYVPHTLEGKFVDKDTGKDLTGYMDMQTYGILRSQKNEEKGNSQDGFGYSVNFKFNNEIPFLPQSDNLLYTKQERKQMNAQRGFEEGKKVTVSDWKKEEIARNIARIREKISGAVVADKIAEAKISGKEKRTITPEVGAEIRRKMAEEKQSSK